MASHPPTLRQVGAPGFSGLSRPSGASIDQITEKLDITPKATHGLIYFLRRDGHNIETLGGGTFQLVEKQRRAAGGRR